jgi:hypothetical protein
MDQIFRPAAGVDTTLSQYDPLSALATDATLKADAYNKELIRKAQEGEEPDYVPDHNPVQDLRDFFTKLGIEAEPKFGYEIEEVKMAPAFAPTVAPVTPAAPVAATPVAPAPAVAAPPTAPGGEA